MMAKKKKKDNKQTKNVHTNKYESAPRGPKVENKKRRNKNK